ncbi:MAG: 50S ribosomal protein L32 [Candidatus Moranbacteria bacterium]|nr:50S ribosomal protein L32 [Candidatus Moranbacteria bacterium]
MAVPKQKHSKGRTRRGRAHKKIFPRALVKCSHCGKPTVAHQVCPNCGYYKDREVINVLKKIEKYGKRKK